MGRIVCVIITLFLLDGCSTGPRFYKQSIGLSKAQRQNIKSIAMSYLGAPYRYGGRDGRGFDCSGLVCHIYFEATRVRLPHSTKEHYKYSFEIHRGEAVAGDLAFFTIYGSYPDHVGLMLNKKEFIHASKSKGVIVSSLDEKYYKKRFLSVRRVNKDLIILSSK